MKAEILNLSKFSLSRHCVKLREKTADFKIKVQYDF